MIELRFIDRVTGQQILDTVMIPLTDRMRVVERYCNSMGYDAEIVRVQR